MIRGTTKLAAVIGWPVEHSASPRLLNAAFEASAIDAVLVPIAAPPDKLAAVVAGLAAMGAIGASVTVPHKLAVAALCDELAPGARELGAVNCLQLDRGRVIGHNTDSPGFIDALREAGFEPQGTRCVLLGNGGAMRAVAHGLTAAGAAEVTAIARSGTQLAWSEPDFAAAFARADLLVDCTSIALDPDSEPRFVDPLPLAALPGNAWVASLVYHRMPRLLTRAAERGLRTLDGAGMLVHQGARAFTWWTGDRHPPLDAMRRAMKLS